MGIAMLTIRIHLMARPECQLELMQAIEHLAERIALESGCISCRLYQNTVNQSEFIVLEKWKNEKVARAHLASENLAVLVGAGCVLTHDVNVSLGRERSTRILAESFEERMLKKKKRKNYPYNVKPAKSGAQE